MLTFKSEKTKMNILLYNFIENSSEHKIRKQVALQKGEEEIKKKFKHNPVCICTRVQNKPFLKSLMRKFST